jgi:subtilisin family serine protease
VSQSSRAGLRRPAALALAGAATLAVALAATGSAQAAPNAAAATGSTALYIVQLAGAPLASYDGSVAGYAATKPADGAKLDAHSAQSKAYGDHLKSQQTALLRSQGVDTKKTVYQYNTTFNGVAVSLTTAQAQKLQHAPGVLQVFKNRTVTIDTPPTPQFLGLTGKNGVWQQQFNGDKNAGNGVIVADLDTGFWPESPSFAALPEPRKDDAIIASKWHGTCDAGQDHPVTCNSKVIGARWFDAAGNSNANPGEFKSPRDFDGHGSHTASTAAGNHVNNVVIDGINVGDVEGMAPGARLAIYKVLYESADGTTAQGSDVDIVAAIDQAVADGADVINFSIGDNVDTFGPDELAFLQAAAAGVFVSAAAGNAGPGPSTVDNAMPWETTVAAGSYSPAYMRTITLGNGAKYTGVGIGPGVGPAGLVDSANVGLAGQAAAAELCTPGTLDPAKVTGKIVLCKRGTVARTDKSKAVKQAGGVGMIMWNPSANSLDADFHSVPTAAVDTPTGTAIKAYIAGTTGATATLSAGALSTVEAPQVAGFSSRGPSTSSNGDLLKPDIMGPGVNVIAAVSPVNHRGNLYDNESGTSMATPHLAGLAALILSKHPNWSPMWVKSALMTTATQKDNKGKPIAGSPLDFGSGQVDPAEAFDPGLVYDSNETNWLQYSCGIGVHLQLADGSDVCDTVGTIAPNQLNYPSIAFGALAGKDTVNRTVTNVTRQWGLYFADVKAPAGYKVDVSPKVLIVPPGRTASFKVTVTRTNAAFGAYAFGSLTWRDFSGHSVYSPIAVQSTALASPGTASGTGASGSTAISLRAGYTGTLAATGFGLVADTVNHLSLSSDPSKPFDPNNPQVTDRTGAVEVTVPAGAKVGKVATFAADYAAGTDVDVYVYGEDASGNLVSVVGQSAGGTADESVILPAPGKYAVFVDVFNNPAANPLDVKLHSWSVGGTNAGNLTVTPASQSVTLGAAATVTASWSGLTAGRSYLGVVEYSDGTTVVGDTLLSVTP